MDHAATMRRLYDLLSGGDIAGAGALLADDFVDHEEVPGLAATKAGTMAFFQLLVTAFPDLRMAPEDLVAAGDKVVVRIRMTGTHQGVFMDVPATGRQIDVQIIDIVRFGPDGLAREHWGVVDRLALLQQLGAIPAGPPAR